MELEAIAVVGPTASGKTRRAVSIARAFNGEIISADSRQLYRGMTIGTGKDLCEYGDVPYHLIDIAQAGERLNLFRYLNDFHNAFDDITIRGRMPVICGGTGMKMPEVPENPPLRKSLASKSLDDLTEILKGYKTLHNTTDVDTAKRAIRAIEIAEYYQQHPDEALKREKSHAQPINALVIGVDIPREDRRRRITERLHARLEEGMVDEIRGLLDSGIKAEDLIYYGLEYKFLTMYVIGEISYDRMVKDLETAIHQFAKRQMTWFRGMEKRGTKINWLPYDMGDEEFLNEVKSLISFS